MALPISYNVRNLVVRRTTTLMTAFGIALTVAVLVADLALVEGLRAAFRTSGHPLQVLVLRKGSTAELTSALPISAYQTVRTMSGVAANAAGEPMVSAEIVNAVNLASVDSPGGMNLTVRGLGPAGIEMRDVTIGEGRWFQAGRREVVVGKAIAKRYPSARLGDSIRFGRGAWQVVGVMDGNGSAIDSEIWGDLNQIAADYDRQAAVSGVLVRADGAAAVPGLVAALEGDRSLAVSPIREREYFERQTVAGAPLQFLGILVSIVMAVGSGFAAMNTTYAAVTRRAREIGTLRVLGFSRGQIMTSFLIESVLVSAIGGVLGCLLALPLNGVTTAVGSFATFSEIAFDFHVGPASLLTGVAFALVVGAIGGLLPARSAARMEILTALREI